MHGLPSRPSRGRRPFLYWRVRVAASESIFLKRTLDRPLKGSLYWRALGPGSPAIVVSHNGPKKSKSPGIPRGIPPHAFCLLSSCEEKEGGPSGQTMLRYVRAYHAASCRKGC